MTDPTFTDSHPSIIPDPRPRPEIALAVARARLAAIRDEQTSDTFRLRMMATKALADIATVLEEDK